MELSRLFYLDSCIVIYLVEEHPVHAPVIRQILGQKAGIVCFSALVELEAMVLPLRLGQDHLVRRFQRFFETCQRLSIPDPVYLRAAELRAGYGLKTPDAMHLAIAKHHACDELWTNDNRLDAVSLGMVRNILVDRV
ncbi:MAG: type II toxin-antitoxin system VapC family toxin [Magnetococcales bacterium]|nr:type II toxin-antitoxin system VapC family toxin [Magnetococcales bacterium]